VTALAAAALVVALARPLAAQTDPPEPTLPADKTTAGDVVQFLAGGALGLGLHESGHVRAGWAFDANPGIKGNTYGFIPFFAITHDPDSPAKEYTISAAGFWMQAVTSEWLLSKRPNLRSEHAPVAKGVLAFHLIASATYGIGGLAHLAPPESDTHGMAGALRVNESWVGALVIAPAVFDTWRYVRPHAAFPRWASRAAKVGMVLLVIRAAN
jgi:hypothetical protein